MSSARLSSFQDTKDLQANLVPLQPLDLHAKQIRILHLLPGEGDDPIRCELQLANLGDQPYYEALSYVWGDAQDVRPILLEGREVQVTTNLEAALRGLRFPAETRRMWVDALCINQTDDVEKTHQVHLMAEIYKETALALLWLGSTAPGESSDSDEESDTDEESDMDEEFFLPDEEFPYMGEEFSFRSEGYSGYLNETRYHCSRIPHDAGLNAFKLIKEMAEAGEDDHFAIGKISCGPGAIQVTRASRKSFKKLMDLTWWDRIWTVQEAVLPRKAIAFCGHLHLDWSDFVKAQRTMDQHHTKKCCIDRLFSVDDRFRHIGLVEFETRVRNIEICREPTLTLTEALTVHRSREAGDSRDMLYALLGLKADWGTQLSAVVDYSLSPEEVFREMTINLILLNQSLEPLVRLRTQSRNDLPTWVHDLSTSSVESLRTTASCYNLYNASRGRELSVRFGSFGELETRGVLVDEVEEITYAFSHDGQCIRPQLSGKLTELLGLADSRSRNSPYPTGGTRFEALKTFMVEVFQQEMRWDEHDLFPQGELDQRSLLGIMGALDYTSMINTALFVTKKGLIGLARNGVQLGDTVHVLFGGNVPFILCPTIDEKDRIRYRYFGHCYVQGIMNGEAVENVGEGDLFTII
ncbi:hypothetical protein VMCG_05273 [Cytospora schulzeri]|uniref:Heterokaryon incompatibility domain-containing protein n=1 Tax=Cytospora schulzeri TaxID=448051 RepID=A0A423WQC7_9PEZI|nr:hypothetical protein VMCG_05273 [Valsa malicola]